jgi:hypothetical protein
MVYLVHNGISAKSIVYSDPSWLLARLLLNDQVTDPIITQDGRPVGRNDEATRKVHRLEEG